MDSQYVMQGEREAESDVAHLMLSRCRCMSLFLSRCTTPTPFDCMLYHHLYAPQCQSKVPGEQAKTTANLRG